MKKFGRSNKIKHYFFLFATLLLVIWGALSIISMVAEGKEQKRLALEEANTPIPSIFVIDKDINMGQDSGYNLILEVNDATMVYLDDILLSGSGNTYTKFISLGDLANYTVKTFTVLARNKYKSAKESIRITRDRTAEEIRIENEKKAEIAKENARIAKETMAKERELKAKQAKCDKLQKKWDNSMYGYIFEIQNRLARDGFYEIESGMDKAPDGSNQPYYRYEKEFDGCNVSVFLQYGYGGMHWSSVTAKLLSY